MTNPTRRLTRGFVNVLDKVCIVDTHNPGRNRDPKLNTSLIPKKMLNKILVLSILIIAVTNGQSSAYSVASYSQDIWKLYMHTQVVNAKQYNCINKLWTIESHWNNKADNKKSSAYGIAQVLGTKTSDPFKQIDAGIKYITHRYKSGCNALAHHKKHGNY